MRDLTPLWYPRRVVRCTSLIACCVAVWLVCGAASGAALHFEPDLKEAGTAYFEEGAWTAQAPGVTFRIRLLDEAGRLEFIEETTGFAIDPFGTPPNQDPRYLTFLLEIDNPGAGMVMFQAQSAWLRTNWEVLNPIGIQNLRSLYRTVEMEMGRAYERTQPAFLESSSYIQPGEKLVGLLVYRMVKSKTKKLHIDIQATLPSGDVLRMSAPYRRAKPDKKEKKK